MTSPGKDKASEEDRTQDDPALSLVGHHDYVSLQSDHDSNIKVNKNTLKVNSILYQFFVNLYISV